MLSVGSLFSGIGGFDLGLERAGMRTVWLCEQDEFCRRVLAKHWPDAPCYEDVRLLVAEGRPAQEPLSVQVPRVDVLAGGFPCQDISSAGQRAGIDGARSGLWAEYARLIRELRPRYVVVENVGALLARGLDRVLGDLAESGYDAEWDCLPASAFGAPHQRDRVWLVAYPDQSGLRPVEPDLRPRQSDTARSCAVVADTEAQRREPRPRASEPLRAGAAALELEGRAGAGERGVGPEAWAVEPDVGRVAHGVPSRVDRVGALGNALVPQIAEWLGHRILEHEGQLADAA